MPHPKTLLLLIIFVLTTGCTTARADKPNHTSSLAQCEGIFLTRTTFIRLTPENG